MEFHHAKIYTIEIPPMFIRSRVVERATTLKNSHEKNKRKARGASLFGKDKFRYMKYSIWLLPFKDKRPVLFVYWRRQHEGETCAVSIITQHYAMFLRQFAIVL